jgi:hypothetical protein
MTLVSWDDLGGPPPSGIALYGVGAVAVRGGIFVYAVGADHQLYSRFGRGSIWRDWHLESQSNGLLMPVMGTPVAIGTPGGIALSVRTADNLTYLYLLQGYPGPKGGWGFLTPPALLSRGGEIEVFWFYPQLPPPMYPPSTAGLYWSSSANVDFNGQPELLLLRGPYTELQPSVVSPDGERVHLFYITGGGVGQLVFENGAWRKGTGPGGSAAHGTAAAVTPDGRIRCYTVGTDSKLYVNEGDGESFDGWEQLGGLAVSAPAVIPPLALPNACWTTLFVIGADLHVYVASIL